ncbi:uncharacterized protein ACB058_006427 [Synchiropus picturatus]
MIVEECKNPQKCLDRTNIHLFGLRKGILSIKEFILRSIQCVPPNCQLLLKIYCTRNVKLSLCGKICGDTMQKSFLEWSYAKCEVERLSEVDQFRCPACTPSHTPLLEQPYVPTRTDVLTIQAIGWNKWKTENLDRTLAKRYIKTVQRIAEASEELKKLAGELSIQEDTVQQWVSDVQQWTAEGACSQNELEKNIEGLYLSIKQRKYHLYRQADGNKRRHLIRKKISVEKRSLEDAITKYNAVVPETGKLPSPNELLAEENYSWPWECHGDMLKKKKVFDKVMLLNRLKEEEVIVVREVKQHWEYMRNMVGIIEEISSQLSEGITQQSGTEALTGRGREGLLCLLKRRLSAIQAQQGAARSTLYQCVFGSQALSLDDSSTDDEEPHDSSSSTEDEEH